MTTAPDDAAVHGAPSSDPPDPTQLRRDLPRNAFVIFFDMVGSAVAKSFFAPETVYQEMMSHLTRSKTLIGLLLSLSSSAVTISQLTVVHRVERLRVKKWYVFVLAGIERLVLLPLVILTPVFGRSHPVAMTATLLICVAVNQCLMGFVTPAYFGMMSKVIPPRKRGVLRGTAPAAGSIFNIGVGLLIPIILTSTAPWGGFPNGFAVCFGIGFVIIFVSYLPLCMIREPAEDPPPGAGSARDTASRFWRILREDADFRNFMIAAACYWLAFSGAQLYITYAIQSLGAPAGESGWFTIIFALSGLVAPAWGILGDRTENRTVLIASWALLLMSPIWALFAPTRRTFYPAVLLLGMASRGTELAGMNMAMEFGEPADAPRYTAMTYALQFVPRLVAPVVAGGLADAFGFRPVFVFLAVSAAAALLLLMRVRDPRHRHVVVV